MTKRPRLPAIIDERDKYVLRARRQTSGRRKVCGDGKAERTAGLAKVLVAACQERQTRRNAEGVKPVALLKVVAKC